MQLLDAIRLDCISNPTFIFHHIAQQFEAEFTKANTNRVQPTENVYNVRSIREGHIKDCAANL